MADDLFAGHDDVDPLRKRERILEREPWRAMRVTGSIEPIETERWLIRRFQVPVGDRSQLHEMQHMGRYAPPGVAYTGLFRLAPGGGAPTLVMSDTPDELTDHGPVILRALRATGPVRILVNGLGLGCVVKGLLVLGRAAHIDVVEVDWDLICLVGPNYLGRGVSPSARDSAVTSGDGRLTIHHADAFAKDWPSGELWDIVWHDVWDFVDPANLHDETRARPGTYDALLAMYAGRCGWQGAWGLDLLQGTSRQP